MLFIKRLAFGFILFSCCVSFSADNCQDLTSLVNLLCDKKSGSKREMRKQYIDVNSEEHRAKLRKELEQIKAQLSQERPN